MQMDPLGVALIMGAVICYILALQYGGQTNPWNSSVVIGLLVGFVLIVAAFAAWEWYQGSRAMVPYHLLARDRTYLVSSLYAFFFAGAYFLLVYYLPIYFQSIDNVNPTESGVRNLPLILAVTVATIVSGVTISSTGLATPIMVFGTALAVVASGLIYTLDIGTSSGKWIGYQILAGIGWGLAFQVPIITGQAVSPPEDLAEVTAIILCKFSFFFFFFFVPDSSLIINTSLKTNLLFFLNHTVFQTVGGAFLVSAAQSAFVNVLVKKLPFTAPTVNPETVIATGATELRNVFSPDEVPGIISAYMDGLTISFVICLAATCMAFIIGMFSKWQRLNRDAITAGGAA